MTRSWRTGREGQGRGHNKSQRGMVLMVAMVLMAGLIFVAATAAIRSTRQTQLAAVQLDNARTFYAAEGAVEWGSGELRDLLNSAIDPTPAQLLALTGPTMPGFNVELFTITKDGALTSEQITSGEYTGLQGYVQRYKVRSRVSSERRSSEILREIQHQFIPLFQFGVFYEKDLEILPGAPMTFTGPIHTNGNLYMASDGSTIDCNSTITVVGKYWHYRKDNSGVDPGGVVRVKDVFGNYQTVWRGTRWLDNRVTTWGADALALWGGTFRDSTMGLTGLRLPLPPAADQHIAVEKGLLGDTPLEKAAKYYYKASVLCMNGVLKDSAGNNLNQPNVYLFQLDKFWDKRSGKHMDCLQIDIGLMIAGGYRPPNGIVYINETRGDFNCVRIINAATLPAGGLTIATDLPVYVLGNYNSVSKKGSSILCDAITILSPAWVDANSNTASCVSRPASNTTVNACIMTGHVNTVGSAYSGGLENLFRFLEDWSGGKTLTYRGSIIDLWFSRFSTAPWPGTGTVYNPPTRNWGYDSDLNSPANWPPGAPKVHTVQRGVWRQIS